MQLKMKTKITLFTGLFLCFAMMAFAQLQYIDNIQVGQRTDASGLVDVHFDLVAMQDVYYIYMEVSFDGGASFTPVLSQYTSGDIGPLNPGTGYHIVWDGMQSFPDTYGPSSQLKIIASKCPEQSITDIDGNTYFTVSIGEQCWMKENLRTTTYKNGTPIAYVSDDNAWSNLTTGAYVWFDFNVNWKDKYGALYNWYAVNDPNGLCPAGWHVPGDSEWTQLTGFIGGTASPHGNKLKSCRQVDSPLGGDCNTSEHPRWEYYHWTIYGTDDHSFSALPGGDRASFGYFTGIGNFGVWWTSTEYSPESAWYRMVGFAFDHIAVHYNNKRNGNSVRCLRD
jgi:uncharacterized protein (TIGR02145 family)